MGVFLGSGGLCGSGLAGAEGKTETSETVSLEFESILRGGGGLGSHTELHSAKLLSKR